MSLPPELDSPYSSLSGPSRRQFPNGAPNRGPDPNTTTSTPSNTSTRTSTKTSTTGPANTVASTHPNIVTNTHANTATNAALSIATNTLTLFKSEAATATNSIVNSDSLIIDPSADSGINAQSAVPTASTTDTIENTQSSAQPPIAIQLFTPDGKLFAVGILIFGLAALTIVTCTIILVRCTLHRRRRSRTRNRARSIHEKAQTRRKFSSDRASEFWSADVNRPGRGKSQSGRGNSPRSPDEDSELLRNGSKTRPPVRPIRTGEAETDLRAPSKVHFTPSVMMSDYTGLSMDVQESARGSRVSAGSVDAQWAMGGGTPVGVKQHRMLGMDQPIVPERRISNSTIYTLDPDPFVPAPMVPPSSAADPLSPHVPIHHAMTFPPSAIANSPYTHTPDPYTSPQYAANSSSPPSDIAALRSLPLDTLTRESSLGVSTILHTNLPSNHNLSTSPEFSNASSTTRFGMHRSSTGLSSVVSDPFMFDGMTHSGAPMLTGPPHMGTGLTPYPGSTPGGNTWSNVNLGVVAPPPLHIDRNSPGIQTAPSPLSSSPSTLSSAFSVDIFVPPPPPTFQTPPQPSYAMTPSQQPLPALQADVSHALSQLRRRMSDSTLASMQTSVTTEYRPRLGVIANHETHTSRPGYFMHVSSSGLPPSGGSRESLVVPPGLSTRPEVLHSRARVNTFQSEGAMYASSVFDTYYQSPVQDHSVPLPSERFRSGSGVSGSR